MIEYEIALLSEEMHEENLVGEKVWKKSRRRMRMEVTKQYKEKIFEEEKRRIRSKFRSKGAY